MKNKRTGRLQKIIIILKFLHFAYKNGQKVSLTFDFKKSHTSFKNLQMMVISISEFLKEDAPQWMKNYLNKRAGFFNKESKQIFYVFPIWYSRNKYVMIEIKIKESDDLIVLKN